MVFVDTRSWVLTKLGLVDPTELSILSGNGTRNMKTIMHNIQSIINTYNHCIELQCTILKMGPGLQHS